MEVAVVLSVACTDIPQVTPRQSLIIYVMRTTSIAALQMVQVDRNPHTYSWVRCLCNKQSV